MKITIHNTNKFPFVIMDNIFSKEVENDIWSEATHLYNIGLNPPELTGQAAYLVDDVPMKRNSGIFLQAAYGNTEISSAYVSNVNKLLNRNLIDHLASKLYLFKGLYNLNFKGSLFNYYSDGDYYYPHVDGSVFTFVYWLFKEPKKFSGGELFFPEINVTLPIKNNSGILFPSHAEHGVTPVVLKDNQFPNGRISFSSFMMVIPKQ